MNFKKINAFIFLSILISDFSFCDERVFSRNFSLKNSSDTIVALKISGKVNCGLMIDYSKNYSNKCFGAHVTEDMDLYNNQIKTEDFLVIKSLKGLKKEGDIVKVNYEDSGPSSGYLKLGVVYLIFLHKENEKFYYEACDVAEYSRVEYLFKNNFSYDKMIDKLLKNPKFVCLEFSIDK